MGHYVVILRKGRRDRNYSRQLWRISRLLRQRDAHCASVFLLAVASSLDRLTLNVQSAYEYVFTRRSFRQLRPCSTRLSLPRSIARSPCSRGRWSLSDIRWPFHRRRQTMISRAALLGAWGFSTATLLRWRPSFGYQVNCALSGGYDSAADLGAAAPTWGAPVPLRLWSGRGRAMSSWRGPSRKENICLSTSSIRRNAESGNRTNLPRVSSSELSCRGWLYLGAEYSIMAPSANNRRCA